MPDALAEAIRSLRVLSDPAKAWGSGSTRANNMQAFAGAALQRVIALHDRPEHERRITRPDERPPPDA